MRDEHRRIIDDALSCAAIAVTDDARIGVCNGFSRKDRRWVGSIGKP
jgi:hypothetical protein